MNRTNHIAIDDSVLDADIHAYVDGQMSEWQQRQFQQRMQQNSHLAQQVTEINYLKAQVKQAYPLAVNCLSIADMPTTRLSRYQVRGMMAASVLTLCAFVLGWLGHGWWQPSQSSTVSTLVSLGEAQEAHNYVVQVSVRNSATWQQVLVEVERLLAISPQVHIDLLANDDGVFLFDQRETIAASLSSLAQNQRLRFIACRHGLERLAQKGQSIHLIPGVDMNYSASEELIRRLAQGWRLIPSQIPSVTTS